MECPPASRSTNRAALGSKHDLVALGVILLGLLATAIGALSMPVLAGSASPDQPLRATPELVGQRYCYGDSEVFSVWLKLRMEYLNRSDKTLILDKAIGSAWYGEDVAQNAEDLTAGKYEYHPNIDFLFPQEKPSARLRLHEPDSRFAILAPGQKFENMVDASVIAQYESPKQFAGSIRSGTHLFQMELSAWTHPEKPSKFATSWRKFGELVTTVIVTEPLEIRVPANPKVEKECK